MLEFKAGPNNKKYRALQQMPFQVAQWDQNFLSTIHVQSFTFKESLALHHCLQIDNDLRLALE